MNGKMGPVVLASMLSMLACADALSAKSAKTEILGTQMMSHSDCNAKIDAIASLLGIHPDRSGSPRVTLAYFWLREGIGESAGLSPQVSVRVSCSGPDRKMGVALTYDSSIRDPRNPEVESYCLTAPPPESAKTEVLGTRTMSHSDCRAKIETIASLLGVRPDYSVQSDLLTLGRFWLKEGRDESLLVTCSEPDRKMVVVLTSDPSIRRGPEAESYCQ